MLFQIYTTKLNDGQLRISKKLRLKFILKLENSSKPAYRLQEKIAK